MADDTHPTYLSPSELGTKDYWETYYARTLAHISSPADKDAAKDNANDATTEDSDADADADLNDEDDPGTSWFSEHNAPENVLRFLTRSSFPLAPRNTLRHRRGQAAATANLAAASQPSILDLGTGNGSMLALLQKKGGFGGQMVGVDYSAQSVELARELQRSRGHSAYRTDSEDEDDEDEHEDEDADEESTENPISAPPIQFEEWDVLGSKAVLSASGTGFEPGAADETLSWFPYARGGFDIVLDKGTFDAISLAGDAKDRRVCERYPDIVRRLVRRGGFLVVTSCNWTEEELVKWFTGAGETSPADRFVVWGRVEYPRFRFGGQEGQGVCTVCFQRVIDS
ncbi:S-adenosylmethionine-dependent methyltransferase [Penicillium hispanicum]|uniref:S-adenosylmethionine-dependent methyltransferase n=1 Tax=Penicillium hispanicum TaxID=1080232 RepID=UPI002541B1D7|nr:S-adenosylmethionine-dependent methyltransferase [Penicillium hispanicum]KAJ5574237.1 S-adenosylmethionine-dependent methyltransferase [Penicillium hispanicum]